MTADASDEVQAALDAGELLRAYDRAQALLRARPGAARPLYQRSLALARIGDPGGALASLDQVPAADRVGEDMLALRGRILKDLAGQASGDAQAALFEQASDAYRTAHREGGGQGFALINAATTALLAGNWRRARLEAEEVLRLPALAAPRDFYAAATAGEALALLGRNDEAQARFAQALAMPDATPAKRGTAARQLDALAAATGVEVIATLAAAVRPPPVLFFAGPMFHADPAAETRLTVAIERALDELGSAIAFGGAAAGADILLGEAVLRRGGELTLVLPFACDDYLRESVAPWGDGWTARAEALLAAATVIRASDDRYVGDPAQFAYGSEVAMGLACLRARHLSTEAVQLALVEPTGDRGPAGTGGGIDRWRRSGRAVRTIPVDGIDRRRAVDFAALPTRRETRSIIFTDYAGFSRLGEAALPRFVDEVMGRVGRVLDRRDGDVLFRNSWGDALFAIVSEPAAAADLALGLQEELAAVDPARMALPAGAGMRVSLHHGPMYLLDDPVTGRAGFFGTAVTLAARIEPITPVGQVYATEAFAALLALGGGDGFAHHYAGALPLAKGYATVPMHRLTRRTP